MQTFLVMPLTITRGLVFEDYVLIPDPLTGIGADLTGVTLKAQLKTADTLLGTFTCSLVAPPNVTSPQGWVQIRMDNDTTTAIPTGVHRGAWSLLSSNEADNPVIIAGGPVDILKGVTSWQ